MWTNLTCPVISCAISYLPHVLLFILSFFHNLCLFLPLRYLSFLQSLCSFLIIAAFLHLGTLRWVDLSSQLQRAMTIPWEVGGRFGLASINLCALPCGRWCLTLMVRTEFHLAFIFLWWHLTAAIWPHSYNKAVILLSVSNTCLLIQLSVFQNIPIRTRFTIFSS